MAFQDGWAKPLADQLVSLFKVNSCDYIRRQQTGYDPNTGQVGIVETPFPGVAAITKLMQANEEGGVSDTRTLECWLSLSTIGEVYPTTMDEIAYDGLRWKITNLDPAYAGDARYAVKVMARAN